jgi:hypothetical protein
MLIINTIIMYVADFLFFLLLFLFFVNIDNFVNNISFNIGVTYAWYREQDLNRDYKTPVLCLSNPQIEIQV